MAERFDFDVAVVGFGPVGQTLSALLGRAGHRVGVFERFRGLFPLPRAIRLDGEAMRVLGQLGIAGDVRCTRDSGNGRARRRRDTEATTRYGA